MVALAQNYPHEQRRAETGRYHSYSYCCCRTVLDYSSISELEFPQRLTGLRSSVSPSGPYRPPGGVEEMQGCSRRVRLKWEAYITV
ncbi:hypothetical protein FHG87_008837 [Trinorchestia longiramus]|nr:hypothetical protein FHG87_008837 [Trinorchestia longiramus]